MDILNQRLVNQQIAVHRFHLPEELVCWQGAVQAQDYAMAKWAIGCRLDGITETQVEKDFNEGKILRTHVLRPTWHFVSPKDIRWMLALTAPKIKTFTKGHHRDLGIDSGILKRSKKIIEKLLKGEGPKTRKEIEQALNKSRIGTDNNRLGFLLIDAELDGLLCSAGRKGKQFAYGLLEEIVPEFKTRKREEGIVELAGRYFGSHGPATVHDFAWWSGLSLSEIKRILPGMGSGLLSQKMDGQDYWFSRSMAEAKGGPKGIYFLPAFDEYFIGYRDRTHSMDTSFAKRIMGPNGIFNPVIVRKGRIAGTWKRKEEKSGSMIEAAPFASFKLSDRGVASAMKKYSRYLGRAVSLAQF
ncbi:MAG TPA: winged helix DNA-binding domain-containing protein [Puia sp.]|jgi:hypothetical protein